MRINEMISNVPDAIASVAMSNAYTVSFPEGMPGTLISLRRGGYGSQIVGPDGKIIGSVVFYPMIGQAVVLGTFTIMSIATGQFFLSLINKELHQINRTNA